MTRRPLALAAAVLLAAAPLLAQQPGAKPPAAPFLPPADGGSHLFRGLLDFHGVEPVADPNTVADSANTIVVVYGDPRTNPSVSRYVKTALEEGGAVLVATDTYLDLDDKWLPRGGNVRVTGAAVVSRNPASTLDGRRERPILVRGGPRSAGGLFDRSPRVATEGPSYLFVGDKTPDLSEPAAFLPGGSERVDRGQFAALNGGDPVPFAVAGIGPKRNPYRALLMADRDVLSNRMIYASAPPATPAGLELEPKADNLLFANSLVTWLQDGGAKPRARCLFIENGKVVDKFDDVKFDQLPQSLPNIPPPPLKFPNPLDPRVQDKLDQAGNEIITRLEDHDIPNRPLADMLENPQSASVFWWGLVIAGLVALYAAWWLWRWVMRLRRIFTPLAADPLRLGRGVPPGSLEHRRTELARGADLRPTLRQYVRALFEARGLPAGYDRPKLPPVDFDLRNPDAMNRMVRALWADALSSEPLPFGKWKLLEGTLSAVTAAADDDRWRFAAEGAA